VGWILGACALAVALATSAPAEAPTPELDERRSRIFGQICARCHVRAGLGAPVVGNAADQAELRAKGLEELVANTVTGIGDMPALGTCSFCTEDDLRQLVAFMANLPAAPGPDEATR